jgi:hypothetical protein
MKTLFALLCGTGLLALACFPLNGRAADPQPADTVKVATLRDDLKSSDVGGRFKAAKELGKLGRSARTALPDLARVADEDPDEDVRRVARTALDAILGNTVQPTPAPAPARPPELVGSWTASWTVQGPFALIVGTGTTEFRADGTYTATGQGTDGRFYYTYSGTGSYTCANGVVTSTGRCVYREGSQTLVVDESSRVSIAWINDSQVRCTILGSSDRQSVGRTYIATRVR